MKNNFLNQLNNLFKKKYKYSFCYNSSFKKNTCLERFITDLSLLRQKISSHNANTWLLYSKNAYNFLLGLMALLSLNKKVIISHNIKREWLKEINNEYEAVLSDEKNCFDKKYIFDFLIDDYSPLNNQISFTGNETLVFYTSGSTGTPKKIEKPLVCLINEVYSLEKHFACCVKSGSCFVSSVSHLHIYGLLFKLLWPMLTQRCWVNETVVYPECLLKLSKELTDMIFISSPAFLSRLDQELDKVCVSQVFSSGGKLEYHMAVACKEYFGHFPIEVYGSTETGGIGFREQNFSTDQPWKLFDEVYFELKGKDIQLKSVHLPLDSAVLLDDDIELLGNGDFILKGRKDKIVKIEEKRISLSEIELFLIKHSHVKKCVALVIPGKRNIIGCAIILSDTGLKFCSEHNFSEIVKDLKRLMKEKFDTTAIPRKWRIFEELPLNSQSKIDIDTITSKFINAIENNNGKTAG